MRLKRLYNELRDINEKVSDDLLLSTLVADLNEESSNVAVNLTLIPNPTFPQVVAYLRLEERRMKQLKAQAIHTAHTAVTSRGPPAPQPLPTPFHPPASFPFLQQGHQRPLPS